MIRFILIAFILGLLPCYAAGYTPELIKDELGNEIILEIDGAEDNTKSNITDIKKQTILERAGYKVERISFREWEHSSQACVDRIKKLFITDNN